jgi:extracellular factor (EF) 3-hydroxypalmitic acid methyl ester biosynthesis protein
MLTGHAELEVAREAIQLGAVEYMIKPFEPADLISVVARCTTPAGRAAMEVPHSAHRRVASNIDLWRSRLPTVASENRIVATLAKDQKVEAKVLRISQTSVQAEIYDSMLSLEPRQNIARLEIWLGDQAAYDGAAQLVNVMTTGLTRICEFKLTGDWIRSEKASTGSASRQIEGATQEFISKWHASRDIRPAFKLAVAEAVDFLTELRAWLEGQELLWRRSSGGGKDLSRKKLDQLMRQIAPEMDQAFALFEAEAARIPHVLMGLHAEYFRACLDPLLLCAPFIHRCYTKPLGYPGDYGMMNMMLDDPYQGSSLYAKIVNAWVILSAAGDAYRHRVVYLEKMLHEEVARVQADGRICQILSLGCGAAREVQQFIQNDPLSEKCAFTLLDFSPDTIGYATSQVAAAKASTGRHTEVHAQEFSVQQMLARGGRIIANPRLARSGPLERGKYDILYCAGLFDYLSERVCSRLLEIFWELAAPGAALVASNFNPVNPIRGFMDYALDWRLIYREEDEVRALAVHESEGSAPQTFRSPDRVEVFLRMRKPRREILLCGAQPGGTEILSRADVSAGE